VRTVLTAASAAPLSSSPKRLGAPLVSGLSLRCQTAGTQPESQEIIDARFLQVESVDAGPDKASHGIANGTLARSRSGPDTVDPAVDLARCFLCLANLPSYPLDRLAGMKQSFGARPARSCLLSMHWIVANHKREGAVSIPIVGKTCWPTDATIIEPPTDLLDAWPHAIMTIDK